MPRCRAVTQDGTLCRNRVTSEGQHCYLHRGFRTARLQVPKRTTPSSRGTAPNSSSREPAVQGEPFWQPGKRWERSPRPPRPPSAPSRNERNRRRVKEAAEFCADSLSAGWQAAVVGRVTGYAESTWERLARSHRKRSCKALARIARSILETKAALHKAAGRVSGWVSAALGANGAARAFTEELVSNIPFGPFDAKMIGVARGVQVTGILLCIMDGKDLTTCECFIDLALAETKERVDHILVTAMSDWSGLARFGSSAAR
jgi:hypothetical protein